jgi:hypothetical protein
MSEECLARPSADKRSASHDTQQSTCIARHLQITGGAKLWGTLELLFPDTKNEINQLHTVLSAAENWWNWLFLRKRSSWDSVWQNRMATASAMTLFWIRVSIRAGNYGACKSSQARTTPKALITLAPLISQLVTPKQPYTPEQLDFLVVCIVPEDAWYVIPVREFTPWRVFIFLSTQPGQPRSI